MEKISNSPLSTCGALSGFEVCPPPVQCQQPLVWCLVGAPLAAEQPIGVHPQPVAGLIQVVPQSVQGGEALVALVALEGAFQVGAQMVS